MKRFLLFFGICILLGVFPSNLLADRRGFVRTVVIDPGHGGHEPGAVGRKLKEKDITLAISLKVGELIKQNLPDVKVIFTRDTDEFVPLHRRAQIANQNHADLFISIHCNSATNNTAYGTETFVMGLHRNQANLEVAKLENASILFEENYLETYDGYDPNSPESNIIFTLFQNAYLDQSLTMASLVQDQFRERARRTDRGVKQAGFLVLYRVTMPAVLVEVGFISNQREEEFLAGQEGQNLLASAIFRAFRDYKIAQDKLAADFEKQMAVANPANPQPQPAANRPTDTTSQNRNNTQPASNPQAGQTSQNRPNNPPATSRQPDSASTQRPDQPTQASARPDPNIVFKVQFASSRSLRPLDAPEFRGMKNVEYYLHEGLYKYTVGNEPTLEAAAAVQTRVRQAGFRDAFVIAFHNNQRIAPAEAVRLLNQQKKN